MTHLNQLTLGATILLLLAVISCAPYEKRLSYEEEIQMKQFREEGLRMDPAKQRAYECAEWRKRHSSDGNVLDVITGNASVGEPMECEHRTYDGTYDPQPERQKTADDIIDQQLKKKQYP